MVVGPNGHDLYAIEYRRDLNLLDISWSGLLAPQDMVRYVGDCRAVLRREGFSDGYRLRVEVKDNQPLPQETLATLASAFDGFPKPSRTALVTRSAIVRMQTKRGMAIDPNMQIFDTPGLALAWILAP